MSVDIDNPEGASGKIAGVPYLAAVSRGLIPNSSDFSFSSSTSQVTSTETTIWDNSGRYIFLSSDTQLYVSSTDSGDTVQTIVVNGINNAGALTTVTATINGQTQVALSGLIENVFSAIVLSSTEPLGDIYIAETDTLTAGVPDTASKIKGRIKQGENATDNGIRVVPADNIMELYAVKFSSGKNDDFTFNIRVTPVGNVPIRTIEIKNYQAFIYSPIPIAVQLTAGVRIEFTGTAATGTKPCSIIVDAIIVSDI